MAAKIVRQASDNYSNKTNSSLTLSFWSSKLCCLYIVSPRHKPIPFTFTTTLNEHLLPFLCKNPPIYITCLILRVLCKTERQGAKCKNQRGQYYKDEWVERDKIGTADAETGINCADTYGCTVAAGVVPAISAPLAIFVKVTASSCGEWRGSATSKEGTQNTNSNTQTVFDSKVHHSSWKPNEEGSEDDKAWSSGRLASNHWVKKR